MIPLPRWLILIVLASMVMTCWIVLADKSPSLINVSWRTATCPTEKIRQRSYSNLSTSNEKRWRQLKRRFRFVETSRWANLHVQMAQSERSLIFSCHWSCGGFGDRLRGIVSAYFLSLITGRRFLLSMTNPCNITRFLLPNRYDWSRPMRWKTSNRSSLKVAVLDRNDLIPVFRATPFHLNWSRYDQIEFSSNMDILTPLFANPWLNSSDIIRLILDEVPFAEAHLNTLFPLLYEFLFRPTDEVTRVIDRLFVHLDPEENPLVCLHARVGKNPSNPKDGAMADTKNIQEELLKFAIEWLNVTKSKPVLYIASDSSELVGKILEQFPFRSFTAPGPILHIDRWSADDDLCAGFLKVIVEFYLLGECRTSLISNSGFSAFANRRRVNPYDNLSLYRAAEKRVAPCDNLFAFARWEPAEAGDSKVFCPSRKPSQRNHSRT